MGSRLFSNTTNLLGGHDFENAADRQKIADILAIDGDCIPAENSWAYHEIVEGILKEQIKGLWVIGTNPGHSWINRNMLDDVLGRLDFLVVQDMYDTTETAKFADLLLPAAGWGEKDGTFINSERRFGRIKKVAKPRARRWPTSRSFGSSPIIGAAAKCSPPGAIRPRCSRS